MPPAKRRRRIKEPRRRKKSGPLRQSVLHPVSMAPRRSPRTGTSFVVGQWNWRASKVLHEFLYEQKTRDGPLVVWGPNGTGKTALVREALREEVGEVLKVDSFLQQKHPASLLRLWAKDHRGSVVWLDDLPHIFEANQVRSIVKAVLEESSRLRIVIVCDDRYDKLLTSLRKAQDARLFPIREQELVRKFSVSSEEAKLAQGDLRQALILSNLSKSDRGIQGRDRARSVFDDCETILRGSDLRMVTPSDLLTSMVFENYADDLSIEDCAVVADSFSLGDVLGDEEIGSMSAHAAKEARGVFATPLRFTDRSFFNTIPSRLPLVQVCRKMKIGVSEDARMALGVILNRTRPSMMARLSARYGLTEEDLDTISDFAYRVK